MSASVLLVDDDTDLCSILAEALELSGYAVSIAQSADAALSTIATQHFDALVCDQNLGGGSTGTELIAGARANGSLLTATCFLLSGLPPKAVPEGVRVLQKPFDLDQLLAALDEAVSTRPLPEPEPEPLPLPASAQRWLELDSVRDELLDTQLSDILRDRIFRELNRREANFRRVEAQRDAEADQDDGERLRSRLVSLSAIADRLGMTR